MSTYDPCDKAFRRARDSALKILAQHEHSVAELTQKLIRRGHAGDVVQRVITECLRLNYLDDRRAMQQVLARMKRKGFGVHRVRSELLKKGLATTEAEQALRKSMPPDEEQAVALGVSLKKWKSLKNEPDPEKRKLRLQRFLRSRGFSDAVVLAVSAELNGRKDPDQPVGT
jgi:regulatory protein